MLTDVQSKLIIGCGEIQTVHAAAPGLIQATLLNPKFEASWQWIGIG